MSGLHRQRVKARLINFPATTLDAAEALGVDVERFCIESLRRLVESMEANVKAVPKKLNAKPAAEPASKPGRGRPPKEAGRVPVTLYIERPWYDRITAMAERSDISKGDALNKVLAAAAAKGILPPVT